jgi:hypothetical protein
MKLSALLASRSAILRQAALAHTAAAWATLQNLSARIAKNRLAGVVRLRRDDPGPDDPAAWPSLSSDTIRASVLEEHFAEEDVFALAEALAYATDSDRLDISFALETLGETYAAPLLSTLEKAGVTLDLEALPDRNDSARESVE